MCDFSFIFSWKAARFFIGVEKAQTSAIRSQAHHKPQNSIGTSAPSIIFIGGTRLNEYYILLVTIRGGDSIASEQIIQMFCGP